MSVRTLPEIMKKQLKFVFFREGEGFGRVVPKHQCQPGNSAGCCQFQEEIKVAHITHDLQQPASTCQFVFRNVSSFEFFSNLLRVLAEEKTEFTYSEYTGFHLRQVIAGGNRK